MSAGEELTSTFTEVLKENEGRALCSGMILSSSVDMTCFPDHSCWGFRMLGGSVFIRAVWSDNPAYTNCW